jgi:hypothetical protein
VAADGDWLQLTFELGEADSDSLLGLNRFGGGEISSSSYDLSGEETTATESGSLSCVVIGGELRPSRGCASSTFPPNN